MKRIYKSDENILVSGVLGGIGEYWEFDPVIVRIIFISVAVITGVFPFALVYLLAVVVIPKKQKGYSETIHDTDKDDGEKEGL